MHGLLALMEIQSSRLAARIARDGSFVPLTEQNRTRWDRRMIARGLTAPRQGGSAGRRRRPLCAPGRTRRLPRPGADAGGDRLAAHRRPVRPIARDPPLAGGRSQSRGCAFHGIRARGGPRHCRSAPPKRRCCTTTRPRRGARRLSVPCGAAGGSGGRVRPGSIAHAQRRRGASCSGVRKPAGRRRRIGLRSLFPLQPPGCIEISVRRRPERGLALESFGRQGAMPSPSISTQSANLREGSCSTPKSIRSRSSPRVRTPSSSVPGSSDAEIMCEQLHRDPYALFRRTDLDLQAAGRYTASPRASHAAHSGPSSARAAAS